MFVGWHIAIVKLKTNNPLFYYLGWHETSGDTVPHTDDLITNTHTKFITTQELFEFYTAFITIPGELIASNIFSKNYRMCAINVIFNSN